MPSYLSKENLAVFVEKLKVKLDATYAFKAHQHELKDIKAADLNKLLFKSELVYTGFGKPVTVAPFAGKMYIDELTQNLFVAKDTYSAASYVEYITAANVKAELNTKANIVHKHVLYDSEGELFFDYKPGHTLPTDLLPMGSDISVGILKLGTGAGEAAKGNHTHNLVSEIADGLMSVKDYERLWSIKEYTHPEGDGYLHVPETGESSFGMVLTAGQTPGAIGWKAIDMADTDTHGLMSSDDYIFITEHEMDIKHASQEGGSARYHKTDADIALIASIGDVNTLSTVNKMIVPAINEAIERTDSNKYDILQLQKGVESLNTDVLSINDTVSLLTKNIGGTAKTALNAEEFNALIVTELKLGTICYVIDTTGIIIDEKEYDGKPTSFIVVDMDGDGEKTKQWVELAAMAPEIVIPEVTVETLNYVNTIGTVQVNSVKEALDELASGRVGLEGLEHDRVVVTAPNNDPNAPVRLATSSINLEKLSYLNNIESNIDELLEHKSDVGHTHDISEIANIRAMDVSEIEYAVNLAFSN